MTETSFELFKDPSLRTPDGNNILIRSLLDHFQNAAKLNAECLESTATRDEHEFENIGGIAAPVQLNAADQQPRGQLAERVRVGSQRLVAAPKNFDHHDDHGGPLQRVVLLQRHWNR